jgi:hypothetical protein
MVMEFTVVCDAPTGCVFDLARRIAPEHYKLVASYWWWEPRDRVTESERGGERGREGVSMNVRARANVCVCGV